MTLNEFEKYMNDKFDLLINSLCPDQENKQNHSNKQRKQKK